MLKTKSYTIKDFYKYYIEQNPQGVDYKTYRAIMEDYYKIIRNEILYSSTELTLPYRLGTVRIAKYKPKTYTGKSLSVNYKLSKEVGHKVYHLNEHSDGYKYRLYWHKDLKSNYSIYRYSLNLVRAAKRELAQIIKHKLTDYPEI